MLQLNIDVLALIIDKIDDVFSLASRTLYRDPGFILCRKYRSHEWSTHAFVRLVLTISPAQDDNTNILRQIFNVTIASDPPTFNYLSLIRVIRWETLFKLCFNSVRDALGDLKYYRQQQPMSPFDDRLLRATECLTRAICFHQLSNIVELEIQSVGAAEYVERASELSRLRRIVFAHDGKVATVQYIYTIAIRLVRAIQRHHSHAILQDCWISHAIGELGKLTPQHIELDSLLPPPEALKGLKIESPRPMDRYLVRLNQLQYDSNEHYHWRKISRNYINPPAGRILQCCRGLTELVLRIAQDCIRDADVFAWAAQEARDRDAGRLLAPAVPLEDLNLSVATLDIRGVRKLFSDAMVGFADSLRFLELLCEPIGTRNNQDGDGDGDDDDDGDAKKPTTTLASLPSIGDGTRMLPQLEQFSFSALDAGLFDPSLLQISPNLTSLDVRLNYSDYPSPLCQNWSVLQLTKLTCLQLTGVSVQLFDPASFASMPCLEALTLAQIHPHPNSVTWMERWTWDWPMPSLHQLSIRLADEGWFSLKVLRMYPKLNYFHFSSSCEMSETMLRIKAQTILDDNNNNSSFRTVQMLYLHVGAELTIDDLQYLLQHAFPCLKILDLTTTVQSTTPQLIMATKNHPTLRYIILSGTIPFEEELVDIGLVKVPPLDYGMEDHGLVYRLGTAFYQWR
ncbi:hypothetical protein DFQ26_001144 [Actinomortierella ambigua]|nr:hypothetical protein DFQ26_001144 [Actinomortierella ambigua]